MKVLFQIRPDYLKNPAGDTVLMVNTGQKLKNLGHEVAVSADPNILLTDFDLVHIFNIARIKESYLFFLNAQKQKKKIVVSPIYWNPRTYLQHKEMKSQALAVWNFMQPMRARLVRECDLLLLNSQLEIDGLKKDFTQTAPCKVIPNGYPDEFTLIGPEIFRQHFLNLPAKFVLCVARILPHKNQAWLAQKCHELGLPLILAGPVNDQSYFEKVRNFSNVTYLGVLQGELLASTYAAAKVHALPSWFEIPGLSSLEAAACGTTVLTTNQGSTPEYFQNYAVYVDPRDEASLNQGLQTALTFSPIPLTEHIRNHFPWSKVVPEIANAYQKVLTC